MNKQLFSFRLVFSFLLSAGLFFGCADSDSYRNTSSEAGSGATATSGAESAPTSTPQANDEEASESKYTLPTWPREAKKEKGKAYPWDEGPDDPVFAAFRDRLYRAVKEKDVEALLSMTYDTIHFSYGEFAGKENFIKSHGLDTDPDASPMWEELAKVLELGGAFSSYLDDPNRHFSAPFVHNLDNLMDPYSSGVIIGENVRLRDQPSLDGKIVGALSWDIYEADFEQEWVADTINGVASGWINLETALGEKGYVFGQFARAPVDYRAGFVEYEPGKWHMDFFIAGD